MTAQTAAGSGTKEETRAGLGPAQAAETRCASKPASAAWVGKVAASRESPAAEPSRVPERPLQGGVGGELRHDWPARNGRGLRRGGACGRRPAFSSKGVCAARARVSV